MEYVSPADGVSSPSIKARMPREIVRLRYHMYVLIGDTILYSYTRTRLVSKMPDMGVAASKMLKKAYT